MAYMNETTFEVLDLPRCREDEDTEGWFPVDELIAPSVQALNQKGYRTTYCCSGHPFSGLAPVVSVDDETGEEALYGYCEYSQGELYIAFDRDYGMGLITNIPDGFYMDDENTVIRFSYGTETGFKLLHKRLDACENLFEWARSLPIISPSRMFGTGVTSEN